MRYLPNGQPDPASKASPVALGLARLTSAYQSKPRIAGTLTALLNAVQGLENVLWEMFTLRFFPGAAGVQLDTWGKIVGEPRAGTDDPTYTLRIQIRVLVNRASGTWPELLVIATRACGSATLTAADLPPARLLLIFHAALSSLAPIDVIVGWLRAAKAAGVGLTLAYSASTFAGLRWDSVAAPGTYTPGWDSLATPSSFKGGKFYGVRS